MHVVYVDVLFFLNLAIGYLLLLLTARFCAVYARRGRLLGGAALGAVFSVLLFFPNLPFFLSLAVKALLCSAITIVAFGREAEGQTVKLSVTFAAMSFALAGAVVALTYMGGTAEAVTVKNGVPYFNVSLRLLLIATAAAYALLGLVFGPGGARGKKGSAELTIRLGGREHRVRALIDTGNLLRDPVSGKHVIVLGHSVAQSMFEGEARRIVSGISADNVAESFEALTLCGGETLSLVPYRSATEKSGLIIAVKPQSVTVNGKAAERYLVGLSPQDIETADGCRAIIGPCAAGRESAPIGRKRFQAALGRDSERV